MQMLWRNNEDHKNDVTASTPINDAHLQVNKSGGCLGYVIEFAIHPRFTKTALSSREGTRLLKVGVKWQKTLFCSSQSMMTEI